MNTFDGYIRRDGTNSKVLLDGGDAKALSSFIGTLSYNNNKITYTKADGTSYDLVNLSNYIYNLRAATSDNLGGIRIGFSQSGKNYPVQLDTNNKAYVYVPWEENSHYTTRLYVGDGTAENKVTTNGNTKITVTDNNNVRNYITLIGSGATNVSSDDNGKITINSTNTTYNTGDSAILNVGTNTEGKLWSAKTLVDYISDILGVDSIAITSLNTLIGLLHDNDTATGILVELAKKLNTPSSSIGSNDQPIYWNGSSFTTIGYTIEKSVPSSAVFTDTKYSFYVGENNNIKEHKNVSNPYFKLFENNTPTSIQIKAGTGISVSSDINGNITIKNESPDLNHNTWRPIKIEGTEKLGSATNTDALNLTAGNGIEVSYDSTNKKVIIKNTKPDLNHDTHYTTSMYIGENNDTKANKAVNSPYFKLFDNDTRRSTIRFVAGSGIGIASDDSGNITITNSSPDQNHNTDKTGIKLGTISGTKKTDSTVIINNSSTGLTIAGGTNKFSIGDGTNYIEIPITPSFTVTNKDSTIGTSLTTIATIAGTDIKAKIGSYLPLSGGTMTGHIKIGGQALYFGKSGNNAIISYSERYPNYGIWYNDANVNTMAFSASGNANDVLNADFAINGGGDGVLTSRGNKIWHAGNDGSGSGLDADTVDGYHAESFIKKHTEYNFSSKNTAPYNYVWLCRIGNTLGYSGLALTLDVNSRYHKHYQINMLIYTLQHAYSSSSISINKSDGAPNNVYYVRTANGSDVGYDYYDIYVPCAEWNTGGYKITNVNGGLSFTNKCTLVDSVPSGAIKVDLMYSSVNYATSASKWQTARKITLSGSVTGSVSIDGSGDVTLATTTNHTHNYLPLSGGTITGDIVLHDNVAVIWSPNFINYIKMPFRIEDGNYFTGINLYNYQGTIYTKLGIFTNENGEGNNINSIFLYPNSAPKIGTNTIYHSGNLPAYPTKESWNYDDRYLKLSTGGTVLGTTTFKTDSYGTQLEIYRNTNNGNPSIKFNNPNSVTNRYIGFETNRNGDNALYFTDDNATNKYYVASEEYVTSRGYLTRHGNYIGYRHIDAGPSSSWSDSYLYIGYGISPTTPTKLIMFYYSEVINNAISRKEVAQIGTDGLSLLNNRIWIKSAAETGGTTNRLELTSGLPSGYGLNKKGTLIYSNGIAFLDPYNTSNNDGAWIRHIKTTGNQGTLEIAVGNDATNEDIHFRWYNTSNLIAKDIVVPRNSGTIALTSDLSNYLTINTNQTVTGAKTFNNGKWIIAASENNEITTEHFDNSKYYNNANTAVNSKESITNALKFRWYSDYWLIGNIRSGTTNTAGFGIALRDNTNNRQIDCFRVTKEESYIKGYVALHKGNSSVSKSGETLTVNIGGTSYSLTNTNTWRGITDSYSGTDSTISLSLKGGNDLYNALLNGYASSAGNAEYSHKLDSHGYSSNGLSFYQTERSFDGSPANWAHYIIANHRDGESYYHYTIRLPFWSIPQYRRQTGSTSDVSQWYNFITEENISSQSVNYATYANYLNLVANDEIRFNNKPSSSISIYFNYVWAGDIADDKIIDYCFMNGNREYAGIVAEQLSCTNGYIYLHGPGTGTYNLSSIFSNSSGLTIETPRATDASNGTVLPLMVKTKGGQWSELQTGTIVANGNITATAFYASSDFRLKNILTYPNYSAKQLASLPLVKYTWKDKENDSVHLGSIAQNVEEDFAELVNTDNKGYKSLDYAILGAIGVISLAREIVELKKEIKELKSKLYG